MRKTGPVDVKIGRRLREVRESKGLSQRMVGGWLGVSFQQIQKYESGTNRISVGSLMQFSEACGVDFGEMVEGLGENRRQNVPDALSSKERNAIIRAFGEVSDPKVRQAVLKVVRTAKG